MKGSLFATSLLAVATTVAAAAPRPRRRAEVLLPDKEVKAGPEVDAAVKTSAADALKAELASRPEWASDIGPAGGRRDRPDGAGRGAQEAQAARLRRHRADRKLQARDEGSAAGGRLKQLAVNVQLSSSARPSRTPSWPSRAAAKRGSRPRSRRSGWPPTAPTASKDAIKDAIKQAVDQAVLKLGATPPAAAAQETGQKEELTGSRRAIPDAFPAPPVLLGWELPPCSRRDCPVRRRRRAGAGLIGYCCGCARGRRAAARALAGAQRAVGSRSPAGADRAGPSLVCPACQREYDAGLQFCPHDARELVPASDPAARAAAPGMTCPSCRRSFDAMKKFCPFDGEELVPLTLAGRRSPALAPRRGMRRGRPASRRRRHAASHVGKICPHCSRRYESDATFCGRDGAELVSVN